MGRQFPESHTDVDFQEKGGGRVVCTQANIPVTVWFIERKEERRNFGSL